MQLPLIEIRDQRQKEWFWVDNEFLNGTAKIVGPIAALVYIALCRHSSNDTQSCYPSMEKLSEETGIKSRNTIAKGIKTLEKFGIVGIERRINRANGHRENNVYFLLSRKYWKTATPQEEEKPQPIEAPVAKPKAPEAELPVWLNREAWEAWVKYRKEKRKSMTPMSVKLQMKFLSQHIPDHLEIIRNSIMNGWTGLFPVKKEKKFEPGGRIGDKARAYEKRVEADKERRELEENSRHNDMLRQIKEMTDGLGQKMKI